MTVVTGRGRKEQYEQFREWCDEHGLTHYILPAFTEDRDIAKGEHGKEWADRVHEWHRRGATAREIHKFAEYEWGEPLSCQQGEHECPYTSAWRFDPEDFDVLIGHYTHLYVPKVANGRAVVIDEFVEECSIGRVLPNFEAQENNVLMERVASFREL